MDEPEEPDQEPALELDHIVVEPAEGATQAIVTAVTAGLSVLLPLLRDLFDKDSRISSAGLFGLILFAGLILFGILQAMGRARQRDVFWEATPRGLMVHLDNAGWLDWHQIRAIEPVFARPRWLMGELVMEIRVHLWTPMDVRRHLKPDPDVAYLVRRPVMREDERFLRLPLWPTKMRAHGKEIAGRLMEWQTGQAA